MSFTSAFSTNLLEAIYSNFRSDSSCTSITVPCLNSSNTRQSTEGDPIILFLDSFIENPNFSGIASFTKNDPIELGKIYDLFVANLYKFIDNITKNSVSNLKLPGGISTFRILITLADGTVFFDSFKRKDQNTFQNFLNKKINENHGTRVYISDAIQNGKAIESKWSSTTKAVETYYSKRIGIDTKVSIGVIAFAYSTSY